MKCLNCGNELSPEEVFCGQCGTPIIPSVQSTEKVNTPPSRQGLLSGGHNTVMPPPSGSYNPGIAPLPGNQSALRQPGTQKQTGFYHDPTEAMSVLPPNHGQNYPTAYPTQGYSGTPMPGGYSAAGQYSPQIQPFQGGNYTGTVYPPTPQFSTDQGYGMPPRFTPPPRKQRSGIALLLVGICLALAIIAVGAFGAVYLIHNNSSGRTHTTNLNSTPTTIVTPTLAPSPSPTPSPTPSPSPALTTTPAPDAGYTWCDTTCTSNGFLVEFPGTWSQKPTSDSLGTQFLNPSQPDEFAAFKTPGATTMTADQLVSSDLNTFSSQPGYAPPSPTTSTNATIGGENWVYQTAHYQLNGQSERIEVYATVHLGKAYIIELEALDAQFDIVNMQYFGTMLGRYQFV